MKMRVVLSLVVVVALVAIGAFAWSGFSDGGEYGLAEYKVQKMTCGSCAKNIQNALAGVEGVGSVDVNVTSGRAKVEYAAASIDTEAIAARISEAGYPAELSRNLSAADYRALREDASRLAKDYVAKIGDRLVSRADFEKRLAERRSPKATADMEPGLRRGVWQEMLQRELLLLAAEQNRVVVQDGEVAAEIEKMRAGMPNFDAMIQARFGGEEEFAARVKEDLIINRNIEDHVVAGETDPAARQVKLNSWFKNLSSTTSVEVYDPALKAAAGGGCGGSCCG
ncbi:hypothetical protein DESUT3_25780 [Desulfuromonas versatilis]|uniref:HMA domain-containing protein n=1 Tax=Desulfuromonas versatilis TaxID=2802975 RepID=A0ABN6E1Y8_9BACT|nr:cation transporter [Desulfuromonas versatilis]BCR05509.1 hypothetical protein DESUT3_25780 [Desulfuromonas versatilis]